MAAQQSHANLTSATRLNTQHARHTAQLQLFTVSLHLSFVEVKSISIIPEDNPHSPNLESLARPLPNVLICISSSMVDSILWQAQVPDYNAVWNSVPSAIKQTTSAECAHIDNSSVHLLTYSLHARNSECPAVYEDGIYNTGVLPIGNTETQFGDAEAAYINKNSKISNTEEQKQQQ